MLFLKKRSLTVDLVVVGIWVVMLSLIVMNSPHVRL